MVTEKGRVAEKGHVQTNFLAPLIKDHYSSCANRAQLASHCMEHWRHMFCLWPPDYFTMYSLCIMSSA